MSNKVKTESIAEYLARGGTITVVPTVVESSPEVVKSSTTGSPVKILTLEEADLYLGEKRQKKVKKAKVTSMIDVSALPEELRKKFLDRYGEGIVNGTKKEDN